MTRLILLASLFALAACSTGGDLLQGADGTCTESAIRMTSSFTGGVADKNAEVRRVLCVKGVLRCELHTVDGDFYGTVPQSDWRALWTKLLAEDPFGRGTLDVEDDDPKGGPYHIITMDLAGQHAEFSAQNKTDLIVFSTRAVAHRLELSNAIVNLVARYATTPAAAR